MKIRKINIKKHFNNKTIGVYENIKNMPDKDIGMIGTSILPHSFTIANDRYENVFDFNQSGELYYDNVLCQGQVIEGDFGCPKKICFLGFSQWMSSNDEITIEYSGFCILLPLNMAECSSYYRREDVRLNPHFFLSEYKHMENGECNLAYTAKRSDGNTQNNIGVFSSECNVNCNSNIQKIILPDNEFINIFAISLIY